MTKKFKITHPFKRTVLLSIGTIIMAIGVAFSIKAELGTSSISSVPYVTSVISGLSVGVTTIIINCLFIIAQILILRKRYNWFQLLQLPAVVLFGVMIDVAGIMLKPIPVSNYFEQWVLCIIGILLVGFGVSLEVMANFVTTPGEGLVLAICKVAPIKFGNMKVIFDVILVCTAIVLSLAFLHRLDGVREGTVASAIFVGLISKLFTQPLKKLKTRFA